MSAETARGEPGRNPEVRSGELGLNGGLAELKALTRVSASHPLSPIPDNMPTAVQDFAKTLRVLFDALGISLNRLAGCCTLTREPCQGT